MEKALSPDEFEEAIRTSISTDNTPQDAYATLHAKYTALVSAVIWALGYTDFRGREEGEGPYWWRKELRERSGISEEVLMKAMENPDGK